MKAIKTRTEHMKNPMGLDICAPLLSWKCSGGIRQTAYQIVAVSDGETIWDSGKVESGDMGCRFGGELRSRQRISWKVCLWDENGKPGDWSEEATFEMAFLEKSQWQAKWINPELTLDETQRQPASYLRKTFSIKKAQRGRLYITCHGCYAAYLNGQRVSDFILAPGTTAYRKRLYYQTYDVTPWLHPGENELLVVLGDGWYRGNNGIDGKRNLHGKDVALLCQLEIDGNPVVISDESWEASQDGAIRFSDLQDGEICEAFREWGNAYHGVKTENFGYSNLRCSNSVAIREQEAFQPRILTTSKGETVLDFGQNMAGYVEFTVQAKQGQSVVMTHGETLDAEGNFTIENFQPIGKGRRRIGQRVHYTCKDGVNHYKPTGSIFGFQYVKLETDIPAESFIFTAHALYSDMEQVGNFHCGNEDVNQLFRNSVWSQKSNFADIPTDCPTRERAGWSGDAGIFVQTGLYLMDCYPIFRKWLADLRDVQLENGAVAFVAPVVDDVSGASGLINGSCGWGDACVIIPYVMYKVYGDRRILEENYEAMRRWVSFCENRAKKSRLHNIFKPNKKYIVDTGFHWGEWCEPDVTALESLLKTIFLGAPEIATSYFGYSTALMKEIAQILGRTEDESYYAALLEHIKAAYHTVALPKGKIRSDRQGCYARPITFGLLTEQECREAAAQLNRMVIDNDYHMNTGFLSTPYLCKVLADYGYTDTAYKLLLQDTCPSWLYAVKKGANTIWETWDGKRPDGTIHDSLNHYSYGAITLWLIGGICGIDVSGDRITIAPKPDPVLPFAWAEYDSPMGLIKSGWRYEKGTVVYEIEVPSNCEAAFILNGKEITLCTGRFCFTEDEVEKWRK